MSCLQQVLIESTAACGSAAPALRYFKSRMNVDMRVIAESEAIPHTLFAAHPRVAPEDRDRIRARILAWGKTPEGRELLARGKMTEFVPVTNEAYDVVRKFPRE
jgi:ABC-type phosphate/phosphonate transport system substrate-binding protein